MNIIQKSNVFELQFNYRPAIVERVKSIEGRKYDAIRKVWTIPTSQRLALEKMVYQIQQMEKVTWGKQTKLPKKISHTIFQNYQHLQYPTILRLNHILIN